MYFSFKFLNIYPLHLLPYRFFSFNFTDFHYYLTKWTLRSCQIPFILKRKDCFNIKGVISISKMKNNHNQWITLNFKEEKCNVHNVTYIWRKIWFHHEITKNHSYFLEFYCFFCYHCICDLKIWLIQRRHFPKALYTAVIQASTLPE